MKRIETLLRYKAWANEKLFEALNKEPVEIVEARRKTVFGSIVRTLHHTFAMDDVWRCHLKGIGHGYATRMSDDCPDLQKLYKLQKDIDAWFIDYAAKLPIDMSSEKVSFQFIGGGAGTMTRSEILFHIVNHGTYHRGHVAAMMYDAGLNPPTTDFPVYLRDTS